MRTLTGLPSSAMRSPKEMRWPTCAGSPFTVMRPSSIICSMSRREPMPDCASTFCSLGASGSGASTRLCGSPSAWASPSVAGARWLPPRRPFRRARPRAPPRPRHRRRPTAPRRTSRRCARSRRRLRRFGRDRLAAFAAAAIAPVASRLRRGGRCLRHLHRLRRLHRRHRPRLRHRAGRPAGGNRLGHRFGGDDDGATGSCGAASTASALRLAATARFGAHRLDAARLPWARRRRPGLRQQPPRGRATPAGRLGGLGLGRRGASLRGFGLGLGREVHAEVPSGRCRPRDRCRRRGIRVRRAARARARAPRSGAASTARRAASASAGGSSTSAACASIRSGLLLRAAPRRASRRRPARRR